jgi:hypothetical protein
MEQNGLFELLNQMGMGGNMGNLMSMFSEQAPEGNIEYTVGDKVLIAGVQKERYNNICGVIVGNIDSARYLVYIEDINKTLVISNKNLLLIRDKIQDDSDEGDKGNEDNEDDIEVLEELDNNSSDEEDSEYNENLEDLENIDDLGDLGDVGNLENIENLENIDDLENIDNTENIGELKDLEDLGNVENIEIN